MRIILAVLSFFFSAALAQPLTAQSADRGLAIAFGGGPSLNDLETGGTDWVWMAGAEWRPATGPFVLQVDVRYLTFVLASREHLVMPEADLQIEATLGPLRPFIGAGAGFQYAARPGRHASSLSANLAAGLRARLGGAVGLRFEARARSLDPFVDVTAGLVLRL